MRKLHLVVVRFRLTVRERRRVTSVVSLWCDRTPRSTYLQDRAARSLRESGTVSRAPTGNLRSDRSRSTSRVLPRAGPHAGQNRYGPSGNPVRRICVMALHARRIPRTLRASAPYAVLSATSGSAEANLTDDIEGDLRPGHSRILSCRSTRFPTASATSRFRPPRSTLRADIFKPRNSRALPLESRIGPAIKPSQHSRPCW